MSALFSNEVQADVTGTVAVTGDVTVVQPTGSNLHVITDPTSTTTVDNAAGAAAVNIQDGGNSLTVDGTVAVSAVGGTVAVTGPLTDAELRATPVPVSGIITPTSTATAVVTRVAVSTTVATLKASNPDRLRLIVHNENGTLFVKLGTAATSTDYTYRLTANTTLEVDEYSGEVTAIKATGTSDAQVTELEI